MAQESPELYYEIQSLNDFGAEPLAALAQAVERIRTAVLSQDHDAFVALMTRGREYLEDRRSVTAATRLIRRPAAPYAQGPSRESRGRSVA